MQSKTNNKVTSSIIESKGFSTLFGLANNKINYDIDYISKEFKRFSGKGMQEFLIHCKIIFILSECVNSSTSKKYENVIKKYGYRTINGFNKARAKCGYPSVTQLKGSEKMKAKLQKEYEMLQLIKILSENFPQPVKCKQLGKLANHIKEIRNSNTFCICSKPGPHGGYFLSTDDNDIKFCQNWINRWRTAMNIPANFSLKQ